MGGRKEGTKMGSESLKKRERRWIGRKRSIFGFYEQIPNDFGGGRKSKQRIYGTGGF